MCCVGPGFEDLVVSPAGFGDNEKEARRDYLDYCSNTTEMVNVENATLAQVGHSSETKTLTMVFKNGNTQVYFDVDDAIFQKMMTARSIGSFLNREVLHNYGFEMFPKQGSN